MLQYTLRRLISTIPVLLGISLVLFFMLRALPGDPAQVIAGELATEAGVQEIRHQLGLDRPVHVQYGIFLVRLAVIFRLKRNLSRSQQVVGKTLNNKPLS